MHTPKYIFRKTEIQDCYEEIKRKLGGIRIFYALKANSELDVLRVLKNLDADFEVASSEEFDKLLLIDVEPNKIICGLPVKPIKIINHLYANGCRYFVFDMIDELHKLNKYAPDSKKILRININDLIPNSIEFGMPIDEIMSRIEPDNTFAKNIDGLSFHISNNIDFKNFDLVITRVESIIRKLTKKELTLNIGGGYRIQAPNEFFIKVNEKLTYLKTICDLNIIAEPGNTVVNSSGVVLTTVVGVRKRSGNIYDVYIDAGKPSGIKTDEKRIPSYIRELSDKPYCEERQYRFIDITCMHKPHFSSKLSFIVEEGDIFEFGDMGAYTVCLSSNFHAWKPPAVDVI